MTERFGLRVVRMIGVAVVSLLLIVGGALGADQLANSGGRDDNALPAALTEPAPVDVLTDDSDDDETASPDATDDSDDDETDDSDDDDATESPDATDGSDDETESPGATFDDHGGQG